MDEIVFKPIGFVASKFKNPKDIVFVCEKGIKAKIKSKIIIYKEFEKGLKGLEKFSHIWVIYFLQISFIYLSIHYTLRLRLNS